MQESFWKYLSVIIISTVKFVGGPITGVKLGLNLVEISVLTALGALVTVAIITFIGDTYRKDFIAFFILIRVNILIFLLWIAQKLNLFTNEKIDHFEQLIEKKRKPNIFSKRIRTSIKIYRKFGILGISILTPIIFSPPVGAIIAVSFNIPPRKILVNMGIAFLIISFPTTLVIIQFADILEQSFGFKL